MAEPETRPDTGILKEGDLFDKYRIVRRIGHGGMAEVYQAEHLLLNRIFALKLMRYPDSARTNRDVYQQRFLREARLTFSLDHPSVVRVFDAGCDRKSGLLFIVMEYVEGRTLESFIPERHPGDFLLRAAEAIAEALAELEKKQIIHRDIKPSNIILCKDNSFKLMDLGIARAINHAEDCFTLTTDSAVVGTPAYSSPEQCQDSRRIDIRSDIYSLGATLYHLASGKPPFQGDTAIKIILKVMQGRPEPLRNLRPDLPRPLTDLIEFMMQKDPDKRPRNAVELLNAIRRVKQGERLYPDKKHSGLAVAAAAGLLIAVTAGIGISMRWGKAPEKTIPEPKAAAPVKKPSLPKTDPPAAVQVIPSPAQPEPQPAAVSRPAGTVTLPAKTAEKKIFRQKDFILPGPRNLENRLDEIRRILAFLKSDEAIDVPMREERLKLFTERADFLEKMLKRRTLWRKHVRHADPPEEIRNELETYLKKHPPMYQSYDGRKSLTLKLIPLLMRKKLDPDARFRDFYGEERPLIGLARYNFLERGFQIVPALAMAGADLDAYPGSPKKPVIAFAGRSPQMQLRMQQLADYHFLMHYIEYGGNNVDYDNGGSVLLKFMNCVSFPFLLHQRKFPNGDFLHFLLNCHGILDVTDANGRSPVHIAVLRNRPDLLNKILLAGIDRPNRPDRSGNTPYREAVRNHLPEVIRVLEKFGLKSALTPQDTAQGELRNGVAENDPEAVRKAVKNGASLRYVYGPGYNILQFAIARDNPEMVRLLLSLGVNIHWNQEQIAVILQAVKTGNPEIFEILLESSRPLNLNIYSCGHYHWLPEYVLSRWLKDPPTAVRFYEILLKKGWDINQRIPPQQRSILHLAASARNIDGELIRFLLRKGADPELRDSSGRTPAELASKPEIRDILRNERTNGKDL